ncbi:MAG: type III-B CRISPR module-associated protein Cmr5 [Candidatus Lokiarchaeota archaeon]|nr:type III-B CRISPR module-associated protein Cmr5 [Candidatus Lokiarchaeota archaeon]
MVHKLTTVDYIKTVEQGRAKFAYERVSQAVKNNPDASWLSEYKSYLKKIPMYIKTNGLGATLAFIFSKKNKDAYSRIYGDCTEWIEKDPKKIFSLGGKDLLEFVLNLESSDYRLLTNQIMSLIKWMARFADGLIEKKSKAGSD